ncbi:Chitin synthase regulator SKT5 [Psilocybe cubensis]|uniref:HCP-like protein n=2 Tax=Psilocybe cubensis TaxID=181762 RepID=A0A8H7YAH5_PSICU|nr:Chitin synthase regulator SKT5 [Psilocybe cubensis]KAH9486430.1 Chitin synthase regulator SKT5 [Psilocybe cubensis]
MYSSQPQASPSQQWDNQQPRHSVSREFAPIPDLPPAQSQSLSSSRSNRDLPNVPSNLPEPEQEYFDQSPEQEDDNDDFFNGGTANHNGGLHPASSYNPAVGDYRTAGSVATQSVRSPSPPQGPILDHSHLRPGNHAALLSHERTLELYRANAKKTQDPDLQFEFAVFMIDASKSMPIPVQTPGNVMEVEKAIDKREDLIREAMGLLKRLADRGHPQSQYFLADCYANGIGTVKNKQDFDRAYPLFVLAAKHNVPDAAYRAGVCCENGWGCRRESPKALQFFRKAAAALHPGAMYRLGIAELNGELGLSKSPKEGVKWLKRSAENATAEFPHALHELALLHERGIDNVLFVDYEYSTELLAQAAELGYAPSAYRLGECYEYGKMGCPQDPALSIHYYNIAAQQNHRDACFALTAWYLVGSPGVLPQSDTEAFLWAQKAADAGLAKAMYAVGYFLEVGIGTTANMQEAISYYKRAAELGDKRAAQRLRGSQSQPMHQPGGPGSVLHRGEESNGKGGKDKDCIIM